MREIKFRGKRKDNNEWIQGDLAYMFGKIPHIMPTNEFATALWNNEPIGNGETLLGGFIEVIPETIGQLIGLYDKNGKEVFEGDVIKDNYGEIGSVKWDNEKSWFYISTQNGGCFFDQGTRAYEIIGNIHENKNLLE